MKTKILDIYMDIMSYLQRESIASPMVGEIINSSINVVTKWSHTQCLFSFLSCEAQFHREDYNVLLTQVVPCSRLI